MSDCWSPIMIIPILLLNLIAVGLITGHVDRFLRHIPFNNLYIWDSMGKGCSACFNWFFALFIFLWTIMFLGMAVFGKVVIC